MPTLIADETLPAKLAAVDRPVEIRAPDGQVLGVFVASRRTAADLDPGISEDEIRRRLTDPAVRWYSAAEVEAKLKEWRCSR